MFWDNFLTLCIKSGKSPNGVAKELDIPSGSITAWKKGSIPRSPTLIKIASYFNVEISALTNESDKNEKTPAPKGAEVNLGYLELNAENRAFIDYMIEKLIKSQSEN